MDFSNFLFYSQKIVDVTSGTVNSSELLLRYRGVKGNYFPKDEYIACVTDHSLHIKYIDWLDKYLLKLLNETQDMKFSLNFDHQELEYKETISFLEKYRVYRERLMIEITEVAPIKREGSYFNSINISAIKKIHQLGFKIALDDIGEGINSIGVLYIIVDYIDRVKFSTLNFRKFLSDIQLKELIVVFSKTSEVVGKEFVVEGVDDINFSNWLKKEVNALQQGYLFSIPQNVLKNDGEKE